MPFSRFGKAFASVQTVMLAMTAQTPPKWVQNSVFYNILNTFSPPGCLRYIVFYEVLLHISESRPSAPKTPRDDGKSLSASEVSKGALALMGCSVKRGSSAAATE